MHDNLMNHFSFPDEDVCFLPYSTTVIQNVNRAQVKVRAKKDNVAGDSSPDYEYFSS